MVSMVKSGQLPFWNPYVFCGYPLLGVLQTGFFYPLSALYYVLPFNLAFNYYITTHYFLAAVFMYWLVRHFGLSRASSLLSAMVFCFSGYLVSMANMNTTLSSVIWAPLILLFYDKHLRTGLFFSRNILVLAVLFAVQFLGGEPTIIYLTFLLLLAFGLLESRWSLKAVLSNIGAPAVSLILAAGLSAVQLLPFLETLYLSFRAAGADYAFISLKAFPPRELLNFALPFFFGNLVREGTAMAILLGDQFQAWLLSPYTGVFPLLFALIAFRRGGRRVLFFWGMIALSLFLAFGRYTPVYGFFYRFLPGISFIRYPVKYIFLAVFSLSILCGFGFEQVQEWIKNNSKALKVMAYIISALFVAAGLLYLWGRVNLGLIFAFFNRFYPVYLSRYYADELWRIINFDVRSLGVLAVFLFLGAILFYIEQKGTISRRTFNFLILSLVALDLFSSNFAINIPGDREIFKKDTPNIKIIKKDGDIFRCFKMPSRLIDMGAKKRTFNENLRNDKDNLSPNWPVADRIAVLGGRESLEPGDYMRLLWPVAEKLPKEYGDLLDMANVKYVFSLERLETPGLRLLRRKKMGDISGYLYKNINCLPRAYFVRSIKVIKDRSLVIKELLDQGFDPRREMVIEKEIAYRWRPSSSPERVEIMRYEANQVLLKTRSDQPRILFLSDSFYPGWKAFVDGETSRIYRANYMFRAVRLGAGEHEVKFIYDPMSFKIGAVISLLSAALVCMVFVKLK